MALVNLFISAKTQSNKFKLILLSFIIAVSGSLYAHNIAQAGGGGSDPCADGIPDASFYLTPSNKAVGSLTANLDGSYSVACESEIVDYTWDLGDGTAAVGVNVTHEYGTGIFRPSLTITDANGLTDTHYYYTDVIVKADNQAPVVSGSEVQVLQGDTLAIDLSGNATDPDNDDITYGFFLPNDTEYGSGHSTDKGWVHVYSSAGIFNYTANTNSSGTDSFQVGVRDGFGGVGTATVTVNIDPKITAVDDYATTTAGQPVTISVLDNDSSHEDMPFEVSFYWGSNYGTLDLNQDGTFTFTPYSWFEGSTEFRYEVRSSSGVWYTSTASVYIDVLPPPNSAPVANDDSLTLDEDSSASLNVVLNDNDPDGDSLTARLVSGPQNGTASLSFAGNLSYTPAADYYGSDSLTYDLVDSEGNLSGVATVSITVNSVNDLPVANDDSVSLDEDGSTNIVVLDNDADLEDGNDLSVEIATPAAHGSLAVNADGTITYTPNADYYGSDSFVYRTLDNDGGSATAEVLITVNSLNDNPIAEFVYSTNKGGWVSFDAGESSDIDGQIVSYHWDFGDGQTETATSSSVSHKYKGKGPFTATLTVTDNEGATHSYSAQVN